MRNFIRLVEAMEKGCPVATHDIELNLKNRQAAIDDYHYGPANPVTPNLWVRYNSYSNVLLR